MAHSLLMAQVKYAPCRSTEIRVTGVGAPLAHVRSARCAVEDNVPENGALPELLPLVALGRDLGLDVGGHHTNILNGFPEFCGRAVPVCAPPSECVGLVDVDPVEVRLVHLVISRRRRSSSDKRRGVACWKRLLEGFINSTLAASYGFLVLFCVHRE